MDIQDCNNGILSTLKTGRIEKLEAQVKAQDRRIIYLEKVVYAILRQHPTELEYSAESMKGGQ